MDSLFVVPDFLTTNHSLLSFPTFAEWSVRSFSLASSHSSLRGRNSFCPDSRSFCLSLSFLLVSPQFWIPRIFGHVVCIMQHLNRLLLRTIVEQLVVSCCHPQMLKFITAVISMLINACSCPGRIAKATFPLLLTISQRADTKEFKEWHFRGERNRT